MDVVAALRSFLRVVETGSFTGAALELGLTQPGVSRQIASLETRYRTRLLHRSTTGLSLTVEGERMVPMARRVMEAVDALEEASGCDATAVSGRVRLSLPAPIGLHISGRLPDFLRDHPHLTIDILSREEPSDLVGQAIDIEVRLGEVSDSNLICRRLGWTKAVLVASPDYARDRRLPAAVDEIRAHDCICYRGSGDTRIWNFVAGADPVRVEINPRIVFSNPVAVHRAVLAGGGLAILSHSQVSQDIDSGALVNVLPHLPPVRLPISAVYASRRNLPLRVRTVLEFLAETVRMDEFLGVARP